MGGLSALRRWQTRAFLNGIGMREQKSRGHSRLYESNVDMCGNERECQADRREPGRYLKDDFLVDCKFGDNVCQKEMPAVLASRVHARLGEQAGPGKGHEAAQLAVAVLVVVMDVVGRVLHQQCGILQQVDPQRVQHVRLLLGVQHLRGRADGSACPV